MTPKKPGRVRKKTAPQRAQIAGRGNVPTHDRDATLRMALEAAGMVTWEIDLRTGVIEYSDNLSAIVQGTAVERYCSIAEVLQTIHPDDRDRMTRVLEQAQVDGSRFECEYRALMLDGKYRWILGRGKTVVMEGGCPARILGVSQDITFRRQMEEDLQKRNHQLAQLASELTMAEHRARQGVAQVLHDELQQLLVAAEMKAHSLAIMDGALHLQQLDSLLDLLNEALGATRAIVGGLVPPVSLHKGLSDAIRWLAQDMNKRHQLAVSVEVSPAIQPMAEASNVLLFTAARELLLNVVKHAGCCSATLRLRQKAKSVVLAVNDMGKGATPEALQKPDERVGFGLFSIRERAELLGGNLSVASNPGHGMCVTLSLPVSLQMPVRKSG